jgi:hypothetical protein
MDGAVGVSRLIDVFVWGVMLLCLGASFGWVRALVGFSPLLVTRLMLGLLTVVWSVGTLTLGMLVLRMLDIPLTLPSVYGAFALFNSVGWVWWWRVRHRLTPLEAPRPLASSERLLLLAVLAMCGAALFNGAYWGYMQVDANLYGFLGEQVAQTEALLPIHEGLVLHAGYPMLIPLISTASFILAGWTHIYLANAVITLLGLGLVIVLYDLTRQVSSPWGAWAAVLIMLTMPQYRNWVSAGYADIPMALGGLLAVWFALRLLKSGHWADAVMMGACLGWAAWAKNTGLVLVGLLAVWTLFMVARRRISLANMVWIGTACAVIGAPWYVRLLVIAGVLIPDTVWVDQADRSLSTLLIITRVQNFGALSVLLPLGAVWAARHWRASTFAALSAWLTVPFYLIWWQIASYDPRFIILFSPLWVIWCGAGAAWLWKLLPRWHIPAWVWQAALIGITLFTMWFSVLFKRSILSDPLSSHEDKRAMLAEVFGWNE